jgi:hypothetical protein
MAGVEQRAGLARDKAAEVRQYSRQAWRGVSRARVKSRAVGEI